jgi:hypothetical protein
LRIFYSFLILLTIGILFFLPFTEGVAAFRTDTKVDDLPCVTAPAATTDNLTLTHKVYNADVSTLTLSSSNSGDTPALSAYADTDHTILVSGLADNVTRTLTVTYDIAALTVWSGIDTLLNFTPLIWYLCLVAFIPLSLVAIWRGRA